MESKKNSRRVSSFLVHTEKERSDKWSSFRRDEDMLLNMSSPCVKGFLAGSVVKNLPANTGDTGSIPGLGRFPGGENGNPLQYSCLGNPMNRGAWLAIVCGIIKVGHNLATKRQSVSNNLLGEKSAFWSQNKLSAHGNSDGGQCSGGSNGEAEAAWR